MGNPNELKTRYGAGYTLSVLHDPNTTERVSRYSLILDLAFRITDLCYHDKIASFNMLHLMPS